MAGSGRRSRSDRQAHQWDAELVAWLEQTCREQGVPVKVEDPSAVADVVALLAEGREAVRPSTSG